MTALLVGLGGALGSLARYGIGRAVPTDSLPWATVGINVAGSFLLGMLVSLGDHFSRELRTGLAVGLLGGFTTFSTFSMDGFMDIESGRPGEAALYIAASVIGGLAAAAAGYYAGRALA